MSRRHTIFTPFVVSNPYRVGAGPRPIAIVGQEIGDGYFCVEYQLGVQQLVMFVAKQHEIGGRYVRLNESVATHAAELKALGLKYGATLEAIQVLGLVTALTKLEESQMASAKLAKPAGPQPAALKEAAKAAPVAAKGKAAAKPAPAAKAAPAAKPKGNPEALAKGRAAAAEARGANKEYKILVDENPGREGSWTQFMMSCILGATDTDGAKKLQSKTRVEEFKEKRLDFGWAVKKEYIAWA